MAPIVFDGREFAKKKEQDLRIKIDDLRKKGIVPKLVTILIGDNPASALYVNLKKKAAERIGAELKIVNFLPDINPETVIKTIQEFNHDNKVHGIMVQLPLPKKLSDLRLKILESISPEKDVDGLTEGSPYVPATVKAILSILDFANNLATKPFSNNSQFCVVGAKGMVGRPLVKLLKNKSYQITECDIETKDLKLATKDCDILISATGVSGLIKADMVKEGAIVIDVGSPKGDANFEEVSKKASFITPVPGGVGPVTITSLLENLVEAASK